ncbi:hypothetical protein Golomagni_06800, partial [Golovinomyces magnicellulatus]
MTSHYAMTGNEAKPTHVDAIVCSVGGGGLFCGIMQGIEELNLRDRTKVIAVETEGADALSKALEKKEHITLPGITSLATSLGARKVAKQAFEYGQQENVLSVVLPDSEAMKGCKRFVDEEHYLVELACGVCPAIFYNGKLKELMPELNENSVVVIVTTKINSMEEIDAPKRVTHSPQLRAAPVQPHRQGRPSPSSYQVSDAIYLTRFSCLSPTSNYHFVDISHHTMAEKVATSEKDRLAAAAVNDPIPSEAYPMSDGPPPPHSPSLHSPPPPETGKGVPTVDAPFNFPPAADELPAYEPASAEAGPSSAGGVSKTFKPIAIPQIQPTSSSPFMQAYAPCLLARGVTEDTWRSFMDTISAFLTAKVGDRAVSHAGDMAKHFSQGPKNLGKGVFKHAKSVGKDLSKHAKKGNVLGVAATAVTGIVSIPIFTALGIAGAAVSLPGVTLATITKSPRTPAERVTAYAAVANEKWLHSRGLHAQLVNTPMLAEVVGVP